MDQIRFFTFFVHFRASFALKELLIAPKLFCYKEPAIRIALDSKDDFSNVQSGYSRVPETQVLEAGSYLTKFGRADFTIEKELLPQVPNDLVDFDKSDPVSCEGHSCPICANLEIMEKNPVMEKKHRTVMMEEKEQFHDRICKENLEASKRIWSFCSPKKSKCNLIEWAVLSAGVWRVIYQSHATKEAHSRKIANFIGQSLERISKITEFTLEHADLKFLLGNHKPQGHDHQPTSEILPLSGLKVLATLLQDLVVKRGKAAWYINNFSKFCDIQMNKWRKDFYELEKVSPYNLPGLIIKNELYKGQWNHALGVANRFEMMFLMTELIFGIDVQISFIRQRIRHIAQSAAHILRTNEWDEKKRCIKIQIDGDWRKYGMLNPWEVSRFMVQEGHASNLPEQWQKAEKILNSQVAQILRTSLFPLPKANKTVVELRNRGYIDRKNYLTWMSRILPEQQRPAWMSELLYKRCQFLFQGYKERMDLLFSEYLNRIESNKLCEYIPVGRISHGDDMHTGTGEGSMLHLHETAKNEQHNVVTEASHEHTKSEHEVTVISEEIGKPTVEMGDKGQAASSVGGAVSSGMSTNEEERQRKFVENAAIIIASLLNKSTDARFKVDIDQLRAEVAKTDLSKLVTAFEE